MQNLMEKLKKIKLIISDVDGVLTDGSLHYGCDGEVEMFKTFNARDGLGMRLLRENGIELAILSGRSSAPLRRRIADMKVKHYQLGKLDKQTSCLQLMEEVGVSAEETVFIGDDSIDLPAFATCGLAVAVADAMPYVKQQADFCLNTCGGKGALRELVDLILTAQGKDGYKTPQGFLVNAQQMAQ